MPRDVEQVIEEPRTPSDTEVPHVPQKMLSVQLEPMVATAIIPACGRDKVRVEHPLGVPVALADTREISSQDQIPDVFVRVEEVSMLEREIQDGQVALDGPLQVVKEQQEKLNRMEEMAPTLRATNSRDSRDTRTPSSQATVHEEDRLRDDSKPMLAEVLRVQQQLRERLPLHQNTRRRMSQLCETAGRPGGIQYLAQGQDLRLCNALRVRTRGCDRIAS